MVFRLTGEKDSRPLSRRVAAWTTNLLAIGVVLVIFVGLGRQLSEWYGMDGGQEIAPGQLPLGALESQGPEPPPARLEIGDQGYSLVRESLSGDRSATLDRLRQRCRSLLETSVEPDLAPGASELRFLEQSAGRTPMEQQPGEWEIHQFEGDFPLLVAIRHTRGGGNPGSSAGPKLAEGSRRVLAWGLAVPADQQSWTLYVYQAGDAAADPSAPGGSIVTARQLPLPAGCRRTLSLVGSRGESTIGIAGNATAEAWVKDFDHGFARLGWASKGWRVSGGTWLVRYDAPQAEQGHVEVRFREAEPGRLVGLVLHLPEAEK